MPARPAESGMRHNTADYHHAEVIINIWSIITHQISSGHVFITCSTDLVIILLFSDHSSLSMRKHRGKKQSLHSANKWETSASWEVGHVSVLIIILMSVFMWSWTVVCDLLSQAQ